MRTDHETGLMTWLSEQLGAIRESLGDLRAQTLANRQTSLEIYSQLTHRMDRMEDHLTAAATAKSDKAPGLLGRIPWRHLPWIQLTAIFVLGILLLTGIVSKEELKQMVQRSLFLH